MTNKKMRQAALGFRTHTGWAAMIAVASSESPLPTILDRRRVEMIAGGDPESPRFVYHAAAKLTLASAEKFIREAEDAAFARAKDELGTAIRDLRERGYEVVASGIIAGNRPFSSPLESILGAHSLIHAAEGDLFRQAIIRASNALRVPVAAVPARELYSQAAKRLGVSIEAVHRDLAEAGRGAGKPWAQDQKESFLASLIAFGIG